MFKERGLQNKNPGKGGHELSVASVTNYYTFSGSKQHAFIILYILSYYLGVRIPEIKVSALHSFWEF